MTKDPKKIRKYRRLRRKAKRLKRRRDFFRFIFKKCFWFTLSVFLLSLFYRAGNQFAVEQSGKLKGYENELRKTNQEVKRLKLLTNQRDSNIEDLQKQIFNWHQKYNQLNKRIQQFEKESQDQKTKISQLRIKVTSKESELELKQIEINNLEKKLQTQESEFYNDLEQIRNKVKDIESTVTDIKKQNALPFISSIINGMLTQRKIK